jgi:hypothetical protein
MEGNDVGMRRQDGLLPNLHTSKLDSWLITPLDGHKREVSIVSIMVHIIGVRYFII